MIHIISALFILSSVLAKQVQTQARVFDGKSFHTLNSTEIPSFQKNILAMTTSEALDCTKYMGKDLHWPNFEEPTLELIFKTGTHVKSHYIKSSEKIKTILFALDQGRIYLRSTKGKPYCLTKYLPQQYVELICNEGSHVDKKLPAKFNAICKDPKWIEIRKGS